MSTQNTKFGKKPINFLILVDQITNHSINIFIGLNIVVELYFGLTPTQFAKTHFHIDVQETVYCKIFFFLGIFMSTYLIIGNSILAIFRTIYLTNSNFVKHVMREKWALIVSLVGGFLITTTMTYIYVNIESSTSAIYNMCLGHSQSFEVSIIIIIEAISNVLPFIYGWVLYAHLSMLARIFSKNAC